MVEEKSVCKSGSLEMANPIELLQKIDNFFFCFASGEEKVRFFV